MILHRNAKDKTGMRFGRLLVLSPTNERESRKILWRCLCDCGTEIIARPGRTREQSCGCLHREKIRKNKGEAAFNWVFSGYSKGAPRRGLSFSITKEQFRQLTSLPCHYCGRLPEAVFYGVKKAGKFKRTHGEFVYNGLDRLDNTKGYDLDNVVPCCEYCNRAKLNLPLSIFEGWISKLVEFRTKKYGEIYAC